jgi:AP-2 complex subunit alpha
MPSGMKGLTSFVSDIRNCQSKDAETKRVEKEMAKIRLKFTSTTTSTLSGYDRKKYVWKLLYCYMLGYDVDFGHMEAVNLCSSVKYSEKVAGYLACALLLSDMPDILRLIINVCKADLMSDNDQVVALALHTCANIGSSEFADNLFVDVSRLFTMMSSGPRGSASPYIKRKAALCLLRMHRRDPELLVPEEWAPRFVEALGGSTDTTSGPVAIAGQVKAKPQTVTRDIGYLTSVSSLIIGVLESSTIHPPSVWIDCLRPAVLLLSSLVTGECPSNYTYYSVPAPWLQIKLLRLIQFFPIELFEGDIAPLVFRINEILGRIIALGERKTPPASPSGGGTAITGGSSGTNTDAISRNNAENAILFEAINVVIHLDKKADKEVRRSAAQLLGKFVGAREANTRYLGLESMTRLASNDLISDNDLVTQTHEYRLFDKYKTVIASQLHEPDISIRRQALNLLYVICDKGNWESIVDEMLSVLSVSDTALEDELVLKVAILAETHAPDPTWYIDVVFKMFEYAPEAVGEEICDRLIQVISGADDQVGLHAAWKAYESLGGNLSLDRRVQSYPGNGLMKLAVYVLGEFGHYLVVARKVSSLRIVELIRKHFPRMSDRCKGIALNAYAKIYNISPNNKALRDEVVMHIQSLRDSIEPDIQQRACELLFLISLADSSAAGSSQVLDKVLAMIPPLEEGGERKNPLVSRLKMNTTKSRAASRKALEVAAETASTMYKPSQVVAATQGSPNVKMNDDESSSDDSGSSSSGSDSD